MGGIQRRPAYNRQRVKNGIYIGLWFNPHLPDQTLEYPLAQSAVDETWDKGERDMVLAHLECGRINDTYRGHSKCRFCNCINGSSDFTDGTYVWPQGFAHYLVEHSVKPPADFIEHVKRAKVRRALENGKGLPAVAAAGAEHIRERLKGTP